MNERCIQIILSLINNGNPRTIEELSNELRVSNRTIRYDLDIIDDFLRKNKLPLLKRKQNLGITLNLKNQEKEKILDLLGEYNLSYYALSKKERIYIILSELLQTDNYITIDYLAEKTKTSRSTISNDLKHIKAWLKHRDIELITATKKGISVKGDEKVLRKAIIEILSSSLDLEKTTKVVDSPDYTRFNGYLYKQIKEFFKEINLSFIEQCVQEAEKRLENTFSDDAYTNLVVHIAYAIKRIQEGKDIAEAFEDMEKIQHTKEFRVARDIAKDLEKCYSIEISKEEIAYITIHLLGSSLNYYDYNSDVKEDWLEVQLLTKELIEKVSNSLEVNLLKDSSLFYGFMDHLRPALYRIKHDIVLKNPMINEIKENYKDLFLIVSENVSAIKQYTGKDINESEIGYFTIHFGAALERIKSFNTYLPNVLIVCSTGIGTSQMILSTIKNRFKVNIVDAVAYHQVKEVLSNSRIDLIISTVPLDCSIRTIIVNPIMSNEDIKRLRDFIDEFNTDNNLVQGILNIIEKNCIIKNHDELQKELEKYLNYKKEKILQGGYQPLLKEVLTINNIKLNVEAEDWREAVRTGGNLLKASDFIEDGYVEAMIENVEKNGAYIVIAPGIAMPHARPEMGAKKIGMSLMTLKKPLEFGNPINDPVKLVVCLCALDHSSHLKALSELMDILGDQEKIQFILNANNEEDIIKLINS